jgi:hypothetical protein
MKLTTFTSKTLCSAQDSGQQYYLKPNMYLQINARPADGCQSPKENARANRDHLHKAPNYNLPVKQMPIPKTKIKSNSRSYAQGAE